MKTIDERKIAENNNNNKNKGKGRMEQGEQKLQ